MMIIRNKNNLKISGKAWEVRAKLREIAKAPITLQEYLKLYQ